MAPLEPKAVEESPEGEAPTEPLYQLGYVSTQSRNMHSGDLVNLLNFARNANKELGISGLLLHRQESFFQLIEGRKSVVEALYSRIVDDSRHTRVEMLFKEPITQREFPDWQMAFLDLDQVDVSLLPAYSNFLTDDAEPRRFLRDLSRGKRLALLFREMP